MLAMGYLELAKDISAFVGLMFRFNVVIICPLLISASVNDYELCAFVIEEIKVMSSESAADELL